MGVLYEARLAALYDRLVELYDSHPPHPTGTGRAAGPGECRKCGAPYPPAESPRTCLVDDMCDAFGSARSEAVEGTFLPGEAELFLADIPDLLEWGEDCSSAWESVRDMIVAVLEYDARERLYPDQLHLVDPATTVPAQP